MIADNFKIVLRQLARNRSFSIINLLGLTIGITVCLFVAQFVWFENSFDSFNRSADRTYRVNLYNTSNGVFEGISSATVSGLAYDMKQTLPNIDAIARVSSKLGAIVSSQDNPTKNHENQIVFADAAIFSVLDLPLLSGDAQRVFGTGQSVVISETTARKYFGRSDVAGLLIDIGFPAASVGLKSFVIDGVFKDIPSNSNIRFDIVLPPGDEAEWNANWDWSNVTTYVRLDAENDPATLNAGLGSIVKQHHRDNSGDKYLLEPISDIRLHALDGSGRATIVNFFLAMGIIVLMLAWFNYVSLTTAGFLDAMREVGIRKLIGASRTQLIVRFLTESFMYNAFSFACAIVLFVIAWPFVSSYFQLPPSQTILHIADVYPFLIAALCSGVLISGFYPAIFLSSFKPLQSIKGKLNSFADRSTLRKVLVTCQLTISLILITAVFAIESQIDFLRSKALGISLEQTLIIESPVLTDAATINQYEVLRNELLQISGVSGVTFASSFPGSEIDWHRADIKLNDPNDPHRYDSRIVAIGTEFLDVFDLKLMAGRNFVADLESDAKTILINEAAVKMFGFQDADACLGRSIFVGSRRFEIIGVINNYHFRSLQYNVQPMLFMRGHPGSPAYAVKLSSGNMADLIPSIEQKWRARYPANAFRYYFLDEQFEMQYAADRRIRTLTAGLTLLALAISFLGLFGLSLYAVSRRIKEIGIRKIFGASAWHVVVLLSRDYAKLIAVGCLVGIPVIYYLINLWLEKYAHRMPVTVSLFTIPALIIVVLTALTVGIKTLAAAHTNPAKSLRYE